MAAEAGHGQSRPLILVTNDDGIAAPGVWDLVAAVDGLGDIAVVAPAREQSWAGRAHRSDPDSAAVGDLIHTVTSSARPAPSGAPGLHCCVAVSGTPARCVRVALTGIGLRPALLLSGINPGSNGGALLAASGTLGAAWEAAGSGIPALAFSRPHDVDPEQTAAVLGHVRALVRRALTYGLPRETAVLNVNLPDRLAEDARWLVTTTSTHSQYQHVITAGDRPEGQQVRWQLRFTHDPPEDVEPLSDLDVIRGEHISLTLLPRRHGLADSSWIPADRS